jgi:hypothetical protein
VIGAGRWPMRWACSACSTFKARAGRTADDLACFGWHCVAVKKRKEKI